MCADIHAVSEQAMVEHWRRRWEELPPLHGPAAPFDRRLVAIYSELIGPPHGKRFLDVGTGRGGVSMAFAEAGAEVFLLLSWAPVPGYAGHRLHAFAPRLSLARASALPFADNSFDIVISGGLLEHFDADTRICMLAEYGPSGARACTGHDPQWGRPSLSVRQMAPAADRSLAVGRGAFAEHADRRVRSSQHGYRR